MDRTAEVQGNAALPMLQATVAKLRGNGDANQLAWALPPLARALAFADRFDEALEAARESLAHFRAAGSLAGQASALNVHGIAYSRKGDPGAAMDALIKASTLARASGDPVLRMRVSNTHGAVLIDLGRYAEAVETLEDGLNAGGSPDEPALMRLHANFAFATVRLAGVEIERGEPVGTWHSRILNAISLLDVPRRYFFERGELGAVSDINNNLALAYVLLGDLPRAHDVLDEADRLGLPDGRCHAFVFAHCVRARAYLQAGSASLALSTLGSARALAAARNASINMDELARLTSLAHEANGEMAQALAAYKNYHRLREHLVLDRAERTQSEARHDPLTGLANRRRFDEYVDGVLPRSTLEMPVSLVLIDVDHFKSINDTYSHLAGDAALRRVAINMEALCRQTDLAARLGGDEFAFVLHASAKVAAEVGERLRSAVAKGADDLPSGVNIRLSIGVAETRAPCLPYELSLRADQALYAAKAAGRDCVRVA